MLPSTTLIIRLNAALMDALDEEPELVDGFIRSLSQQARAAFGEAIDIEIDEGHDPARTRPRRTELITRSGNGEIADADGNEAWLKAAITQALNAAWGL
jgi:hypothetical protein